jgi:PAS domain S-box-containing protein
LLSSLARQSEDLVLVALLEGDRAESLKEAVSAGVTDWMPTSVSREALDARIVLLERAVQRLSEQRLLRDRLQAREIEHALLEQCEASFHALLDASPDPIAVHRDEKILYVNPASVSIFGYASLEGAVGRHILDFVHPDDRESARQRVAMVTTTGRSAPLRQMRFLAVDGRTLIGEAFSFRVHYRGAPAVMTVGRDLTEHIHLQRQLLHSERLATIGGMTAAIAHELRNPLTYVLGNLVDLSRRVPPLAHQVSQDVVQGLEARLQSALEGAEQLRNIAQDLSQFARLRDEDVARVDLTRALDGALRMAVVELHDVDLQLEWSTLPWVSGSELRFSQVFLNLLINAAHAVRESVRQPRYVRVRTLTDEKGWAVVEIQDSGVGIEPRAIETIFEPFYTTKSAGRGTGLGLAVARTIVTRAGGEITVESELGKGATFRVRLPPVAAVS